MIQFQHQNILNTFRVATVREKSGKFQSFSESGKSQGIFFCQPRDNPDFTSQLNVSNRLVTQTCISKLVPHWFRLWLVTGWNTHYLFSWNTHCHGRQGPFNLHFNTMSADGMEPGHQQPRYMYWHSMPIFHFQQQKFLRSMISMAWCKTAVTPVH